MQKRKDSIILFFVSMSWKTSNMICIPNLCAWTGGEVYDNKLSGPVPKEIGKLRKLISLDLYNNQLSWPIPATLGNLKSLN